MPNRPALPALWNNIEARLDADLPEWRERVDGLRQLQAVERRLAGRIWSDDEVFKGLLMAVLSSETPWSKIEEIKEELSGPFCGFSLKWYAALSTTEVRDRLLPWFEERKAGSRNRGKALANLIAAARKLLKHKEKHGTADSYFTSLVDRCDGDPKCAALQLGRPGEYKLPSLGPPLAAEALKNLGFEVAKPDRHISRAVASFELVQVGRWSNAKEARDGWAAPKSTSKRSLLDVMAAVQEIAEAAGESVVLVDNAIWLLCAEKRSGLHLTNRQLAEIAHESESPQDRAEGLGALIRSWMEEENVEEQRETMEHLIRTLDEDRLSDRKLFPIELKGKTW